MILKWLPSLSILMQGSFWWWQRSDRYILSLFPHLHTPSPFTPSLISLMVSVDVKHYVYQRASTGKATDLLRLPPDNICLFPAWQWLDFPNYNRGMDRYFSCFLDNIKVFEPSEEGDSTGCASDSPMLQMMRKNEAPHRLLFYLDTTRPISQHHSLSTKKWGVDWHPKNQSSVKETGPRRSGHFLFYFLLFYVWLLCSINFCFGPVEIWQFKNNCSGQK